LLFLDDVAAIRIAAGKTIDDYGFIVAA